MPDDLSASSSSLPEVSPDGTLLEAPLVESAVESTIKKLAEDLRGLKLLCLIFGFGHGTAVCFYVGSGGYYGDLFSNTRFFIYQCAFFYLPPILITAAAVMFDQSLNVMGGVRRMLCYRIYISSLVLCVLLFILCFGSCVGKDLTYFDGEGWFVFFIGGVLGTLCGLLLSSLAGMFGPVSAQLVPIILFGQTAAGVYTNLVARAVGFEPDCECWRVHAYWGIGAVTLGLIIGVFWWFHRSGRLENTFVYQEQLLDSVLARAARATAAPMSPVMNTMSPMLRSASLKDGLNSGAAMGSLSRTRNAQHDSSSTSNGESGSNLKFPAIVWSMAVCQTVAIAMNMSLTPLSNQIGQGNYTLTQSLVLTKLLADFVGRTLFFIAIPTPRPATDGWALNSTRGHAALAWFVEMCRLPLWISIYTRATTQDPENSWSSFLENETILLYVIWLPLISAGAMSSSWCSVVATVAAKPEQRSNVGLLMTCSIYVGFMSGLTLALLT